MKTTKKTKTGITRKTSVSRAKVRKAVKSVMKQRTETKKKVSLSAIKTRSKMKEKNYVFVYEDRKKNELQRKTHQFYNITEARKFAAKLLANSNMNDLHKIVVRLDEFNDFVNKRSKKGVGGVKGKVKTHFSIISYYDPYGDMKSTRKEFSRDNYESKKSFDEVRAIIEKYNNGKYYNAVRLASFDGRKKQILNFDKSIYLTSKAKSATYQHIPGL
ncbi:MAG: hypothetical protein EOM73_13400 [Bacteroidia bacterium]|nr:hypothetical protein [Bacteroidia bacterium]